MMQNEEVKEFIDSIDVLVVGAGPSGIAAAVMAGRNGSNVLLVEQSGMVGGVSTNGLMSHFAGIVDSNFYHELLERQAKFENRDNSFQKEIINSEVLKVIYLQMLSEAGVKLRFYTFISDVTLENKKIRKVILESKSGKQFVETKVVIDCTGDGDVAAKAGADYILGRESDSRMQPATLMFKVGGVDYDKALFPCSFESYMDTEKGEIQHLAKEHLKFPMGHVLLYKTSLPGVVTCNMTNCLNIDGTKAESLTEAEIKCHLQLYEIEKFLREYIPGYENCFIICSASNVGIRETRHFKGDYTLTENDIYSAHQFEDWIVKGALFNFDVHNLSGSGLDVTGAQENFNQRKGYTIPYRSLIPLNLDNVLLAGRCISGTHIAHSNYRVMPICIAMGAGAGVAASLACSYNGMVREVSAKAIQEILVK